MKGVDGVDMSTPYGACARGLSGQRTLSLMNPQYIWIQTHRDDQGCGRVHTVHTLSGLCAGCLANPGTLPPPSELF